MVQIHKKGDLHWVGDGFPVRSIFSYNDLGKELSPFLLLDYAEPYEFSPSTEKRGVGGHPHRGFETVTIVYQGELEHRDSAGGGGKIGPGDVQWMTAGAGLVHEEFHSKEFTEKGGTFEVAQLWVNLPAKDKDSKPRYQTLLKKDIPTVKADFGELRVISGEFQGRKGPAITFTPINLWDLRLNAKAHFETFLARSFSHAFLILEGEVIVEGENAKGGELVILDEDDERSLIKAARESKLLFMSGEKLNEPVVGYGPFVMTSQAEIRKAYEDFHAGKYGKL